MLLYTAERPKRRISCFCTLQKDQKEDFRAWRKSFPERFGISALGESHFPKGLAFPRSAKLISRKVWSFRAWRKSFHESLDNLTPRDVYLGQGEKIKKIREFIKQNSINKRFFDNKTMKYQSK